MFLPPQAGREELLSYVRPLYPNGIFPLGAGWRIVFYIVSGIFLAGWLIYHSPRRKRRREAFAAFGASRRSFLNGGDVSVLAGELSVLMRRVALSRFDRKETAGLNGGTWIDFLKRTGAVLNEEDERLLISEAYAPPSSGRDEEAGRHLLRSVRKWLERNL